MYPEVEHVQLLESSTLDGGLKTKHTGRKT